METVEEMSKGQETVRINQDETKPIGRRRQYAKVKNRLESERIL